MIELTDYRIWLAPGEYDPGWWTTQGPSRPELVAAAHDRLARATEALGGKPPKARYWLNNGWFVSASADAVSPTRVGDQHWRCWIPATPPPSSPPT